MLLDDRKKRILRAVVDGYIITGEPVGSRTIARRYEEGLSSATIRNEMADLEDMGYLEQPHTSAGRIPSDKGYRLYVDELMKKRQLSMTEIENINNSLKAKIGEIGQMIKQASLVLSQATKYTSMAIAPQVSKSIIKTVQLVPVDQTKALVVIVTSSGAVESIIARTGAETSPGQLSRLTTVLNESLRGLAIEQITSQVITELQARAGEHRSVLSPVLKAIFECINSIDSKEVYLEGTTNMLNFPEYSDINRVKEVLGIFDAKDVLYKMLNSMREPSGVNVTIGSENGFDEMRDCSVVTAAYNMGDKTIGRIGVIGPMRMNYAHVISYIEFVRDVINREISKIICEISGDG